MNDVRRQLIVYERNGRILKWHDRMIPPGTNWRDQIDIRLEMSQVVLLFMSPHFIESRYCYEVEGDVALRRHNAGVASVVPIILRPCAWEDTPFGAMQALPSGAKPISRWTDRDEACLDAAKGVMKIVDDYASAPVSKFAAVSQSQSCAYCRRCGHVAGNQSVCTGHYVHHEFDVGSSHDYCKRCGQNPGARTTCTGHYIHHDFKIGDLRPVICRRCGVSAGQKTVCTGHYIFHDFAKI